MLANVDPTELLLGIAVVSAALVFVLVAVGVNLARRSGPKAGRNTAAGRSADWYAVHGTRTASRLRPGRCSKAGCRATRVYACAYRDRRDRLCAGQWCPEHSVLIDDLAYCKRHAGVLMALRSQSGTVLGGASPDLDDRSVPLLNQLFERLTPGVERIFQEAFLGNPDISSGAANAVTDIFEPGARDPVAWQRSWDVFNQRGYLLRVPLRVTISEPPEVEAYVDQVRVFARIPDWIAKRLQGQSADPDDQVRFDGALLRAVQTEVDRRAPAILDQMERERLSRRR